MSQEKIYTKLTDLIIKISSYEYFFVSGKTDEIKVKEFERSLGVLFPDQYRFFLLQYGSLFWLGNSFYGSSSEQHLNLIERNKKLNNKKLPSDFLPYPENSIAIKHYAGGGYYLLFCKGSPREGEVILVEDEMFNEEVECWPDFCSFLEYCSQFGSPKD